METRPEPRAYDPNEERSLGTLFADMMREITTLVQQEIALARTEVSEKVSQISTALASLLLCEFSRKKENLSLSGTAHRF